MQKKGSVLIYTLWVLIILAILSIVIARRASTDVKLAKRELNNIKSTYLAKAAVMKMLAELVDKDTTPDYDSLNEDWHRTKDNPKELKIKNDTVFYGATDEESRLNLNGDVSTQVKKDLFKQHLDRLDVDWEIIDGIITYRVGENEQPSKDFEFMEELFLVDGMTHQVYSEIRNFGTIYRKNGHKNEYKVNINTAGEKVLMALIDDTVLVGEILGDRENDGVFINEQAIRDFFGEDRTDLADLFMVESNVFRIWAQVSFSEDKEIFKEVEAIVDRSKKIHRWKEY